MKKIATTRLPIFIILFITVLLIFAKSSHLISMDRRLIGQFLTALYEVPDHTRYQALMEDIESWRKSDLPPPRGFSVLSPPQELFRFYVEPLVPFTTNSCLINVIATADYLRADKFSAENSRLLKVTDISLTKEYSDETRTQYTYIVTIDATHDLDHTVQTMVAEGNVVVIKDIDGRPKVDAYKILNRSIFSKPLTK